MSNNLKYFSGQITSEELAARIYDRYALQTMGIRAKTNYSYTSRELAVIIRDIQAYLDENSTYYGVSRRSIELKGKFISNSEWLQIVGNSAKGGITDCQYLR